MGCGVSGVTVLEEPNHLRGGRNGHSEFGEREKRKLLPPPEEKKVIPIKPTASLSEQQQRTTIKRGKKRLRGKIAAPSFLKMIRQVGTGGRGKKRVGKIFL